MEASPSPPTNFVEEEEGRENFEKEEEGMRKKRRKKERRAPPLVLDLASAAVDMCFDSIKQVQSLWSKGKLQQIT